MDLAVNYTHLQDILSPFRHVIIGKIIHETASPQKRNKLLTYTKCDEIMVVRYTLGKRKATKYEVQLNSQIFPELLNHYQFPKVAFRTYLLKFQELQKAFLDK